MRVRLPDNMRRDLFHALALVPIDMDDIAKNLGVSERTVRDWRRGKFTMSYAHYSSLANMSKFHLELPNDAKISDDWHRPAAARKGGLARVERYGPPGNQIGRSKGGRVSFENRLVNSQIIGHPRPVFLPGRSSKLAEFIGILIGDGGLTKYQVTISLSALVDSEYVPYVANLAQELFELKPAISERLNEHCVTVKLSAISLVNFLSHQGLKPGNKLRNGLDMPDWIKHRQDYAIACVRGLF